MLRLCLPCRITFFILAYFFIVVAPVLFAAAIYICLSRVVALGGSHSSPLSPKIIFVVFLSFDIVTIAIQIAGASLIGSKEHNHEDSSGANDILIAGLAIQTASFAVFLVILLACLQRLRNTFSQVSGQAGVLGRVRWYLGALLVAGVLVQIRTVFRLIESATGVFSYLSSHEAYFGTLEFLPIALAIPILCYLGYATRAAHVDSKPDSLDVQLSAHSTDV